MGEAAASWYVEAAVVLPFFVGWWGDATETGLLLDRRIGDIGAVITGADERGDTDLRGESCDNVNGLS